MPIFSIASTSEITNPTTAKRLKLDGNKFFLNGQKKLLSPFTGAEFQGLIMQNQITPNICNQIAKDQYFKLAKMFKSDEVVSTVISALPSGAAGVTITATTTNANTGKEPTTKADIFYLLYQFGQFYLQVYPNKMAGFLEYLGFLTKECQNFSAAGLLHLDHQIHSQYMNNPDWNWEQSRYEIHRVFEKLKSKAENLLQGAVVSVTRLSTPRSGKPNSGSQFPKCQSSTFGTQGQGSRQLTFGSCASGDQQQQPGNRVEHCNNYNFQPKGCKNSSKYNQAHMCAYCGNPSHLAPFCTNQYYSQQPSSYPQQRY